MDIPQHHKEIFKIIGGIASSLNQKAYVVGGYVRDYYLDKPVDSTTDIDFVTIGSGIELARKTAQKLGTKSISVFKQFGTAQVKYQNLELEFVGARKESYRRDSRKPIV